MENADVQTIIDAEHLRLVRIGFMVSAATSALFGCFGFIYAFMGAMIATMAERSSATPGPPQAIGWLFATLGLTIAAGGLGLAGARLYAAKCIRERRGRLYCIIMAAICCLEFPYGTIFAVLALIVLGRSSVETLFGARDSGPATRR